MSRMSTLHAARITVEEMAAYLAEHPEVDFDEAVRAIEERHTGEGEAYHENLHLHHGTQ